MRRGIAVQLAYGSGRGLLVSDSGSLALTNDLIADTNTSAISSAVGGAVLVDMISNPSPRNIGAAPPAMLTGAFAFTWTPSVADSALADNDYVLVNWGRSTTSLYVQRAGVTNLVIYDDTTGAIAFAYGVSFAAGVTVSISVDLAALTISLSGFTAGNGTYAIAAGFSPADGDGTIDVGRYFDGAYQSGGTYGNFTAGGSTGVGGTSSAAGTLSSAAAASTIDGSASGLASGSASLSALGTLSGSVAGTSSPSGAAGALASASGSTGGVGAAAGTLAASALLSATSRGRALGREPRSAFIYSYPLPGGMRDAYDRIIVEPGHPHTVAGTGAELVAYLSVGEVSDTSPDVGNMLPAWIIGRNEGWGSSIMDLSSAAYRADLVGRRAAALYALGYRSLFLDVLDSFQLVILDEPGRALQRAGLVAVIQALRATFPTILINRGFDVVAYVAPYVQGMVAESLFRTYTSGAYAASTQNDKDWLLPKLLSARDTYGLPVTVIDYVAPGDTATAQGAIDSITALGFTAYVSDVALSTAGLGGIGALSIPGTGTTASASGALSGSSSAASSASSTASAAGALSASALGTSSATASTSSAGSLAATSAGTSAASSVATGRGSLSGSAAGSAAPSAAVTARGDLAGSVAATGAASAAVFARAALAGAIAGAASASAAVTARGALSGSSGAVASASASLLAPGTLAGQAQGASLLTVSALESGIPFPPPHALSAEYRSVWRQDFTTLSALSVSANGPCGNGAGLTTWMAHKPGYGEWFLFNDPSENLHPFSLDGHELTIRVQKDGALAAYGGYTGGLLSSADHHGDGFTQKYGYFEACMRVPGGANTWPSFWLLGVENMAVPGTPIAELDVTELYGNAGAGPGFSPPGNPSISISTWHKWSTPHEFDQHIVDASLPPFSTDLSAGFHTFGVDVGPTEIKWYLDRQLYWTTPAYPESRRPLAVLLNLALGGGNYTNATNDGYDWSLTPDPTDLKVKYVAVWASPDSPNYTDVRTAGATGVGRATASLFADASVSGSSGASSLARLYVTDASYVYDDGGALVYDDNGEPVTIGVTTGALASSSAGTSLALASASGSASLSGASGGVALALAVVSARGDLAATSVATGAASSQMAASGALSAASGAASTATAVATGRGALAATLGAAGAASALLSAVGALAVSALAGTASASGSLVARGALAGTSGATSGASAVGFAQATGGALASGTSAASATIFALSAGTCSASGIASAAATLVGLRAASGSSAGAASSSGASLAGAGLLGGSALALAGSSASLGASGALAASAAGSASASASAGLSGALACVSAGIASASASMTARGALLGSVSGSSSAQVASGSSIGTLATGAGSTILLDLATNPAPHHFAVCPPAILSGRWSFTWTPAVADTALAPNDYVLVSWGPSDTSLYVQRSAVTNLGLYDQTTGTWAWVTGVSFSAGQPVTIATDTQAQQVTLSGFASGNGTYATTAFSPADGDGSVDVGQYFDGNYASGGTFSNFTAPGYGVGGTSAVTGTLTVGAQVVLIAGNASGMGYATAAPALTMAGYLVGTSSAYGRGEESVTLSGLGALAAAASGTGTAQATGIALQTGGALAVGTSSAFAAIGARVEISAAASGTSAASALILAQIAVYGAAAGSAAVPASLYGLGSLAGVLASQSGATASPSARGQLAGTSAGGGLAIAATGGSVPGVGTVAGMSSAAAALVGSGDLVSVVAGSSSASVAGSGAVPAQGAVSGTGAASASVSGRGALLASVGGAGDASLAGTVGVVVSGAAGASSAASGVIVGVGAVAGAARGKALALAATLGGVAGAVEIAGSAGASGELSALADLSGEISGASVAHASGASAALATSTASGSASAIAELIALGGVAAAAHGTGAAAATAQGSFEASGLSSAHAVAWLETPPGELSWVPVSIEISPETIQAGDFVIADEFAI